MHNAQKISQLTERFGKEIKVLERIRVLGFIPVTLSCGWLWISVDANDHWSVTLASRRTGHYPIFSPAFGADFRKDNGERKIGPLHLRGAWKSAISMWPITEDEEADRVFNLIASRIDAVYRYHFMAPA